MVKVNVALVIPSASMEAVEGEIDAVRAELTITVAVLDVMLPPLESVTMTETESVPVVVDVTVQLVSEEVHPDITVSPTYDQA